jgi:hypothetical protein
VRQEICSDDREGGRARDSYITVGSGTTLEVSH